MHHTILSRSACSTSYAVPRPLPRCRGAPSRTRTIVRASPLSMFDLMDRQFAEMDRQFELMQQQMDRDMDAAFSRARALERQADAEVQRALRDSASSRGSLRSSLQQELRSAPNVDIQRQEERAPGFYRYYERIQITDGGLRAGAYASLPPAAATTVAPAASPSFPLLVGAMVAVGGYVALTAAFNRNYPLTSYTESKRWLLLLLWPLLVLFSPKFREQFAAAVRGERVGLKREGDGGGSNSSSGGPKL